MGQRCQQDLQVVAMRTIQDALVLLGILATLGGSAESDVVEAHDAGVREGEDRVKRQVRAALRKV